MLIGLVLFVLGIVLIVSHPLLGFIPGVLLILLGVVAVILGTMARGALAVWRIGTSKTCPECRSQSRTSAVVCRYCGHRFEPPPPILGR